jgi:cytochrome c-type biogenesis protein CcmH/NrfF
MKTYRIIPSTPAGWLTTLAVALSMVIATTAPDRASAQSSSGKATSTPASEGQVSNVVQSLSQEIMSPYCPGKTLAMCPSGGAAELRRRIQDKAEHGKSKAEIKEEIIDEIGEKYRREEPPTSDNVSLAALVVLGLLFCFGAVWYLARGTDDEPSDSETPGRDLDADDEAYVEALRDEYME